MKSTIRPGIVAMTIAMMSLLVAKGFAQDLANGAGKSDQGSN